jgi:bile acid:Na+ symporter, BASS family
MNLASLIPLLVKASIWVTVFALGLEVSIEDVLFLVRKPALLLRSLLAMDVIMPLVAVALAVAFDLHPAVKIALVALALSPVPPVLPKKQIKAAGASAYAFGLLVTAGLFAIVFIPFALNLIERLRPMRAHLSAGQVALIVLITVLAPLATGLIVRRIAPAVAQRIVRPISIVATVLLLAGVAPILFTKWPEMVEVIGNGTLVAIAAFVVVGLIVGHLLGGPDPADRTVLALSTAARHPGVALAIATAAFPEQKLVLPAVLLYLIVGAILAIPYSRWRQRRSRNTPAVSRTDRD